MSTEQVLSEYPWLRESFYDRRGNERLVGVRVARASLDLFLSESEEADESVLEEGEDYFERGREVHRTMYSVHMSDGTFLGEYVFMSPSRLVDFLLSLSPKERKDAVYVVESEGVWVSGGNRSESDDFSLYDNDLESYGKVLYKPPKGYKSIGEYVWKRRRQLRRN